MTTSRATITVSRPALLLWMVVVVVLVVLFVVLLTVSFDVPSDVPPAPLTGRSLDGVGTGLGGRVG